MGKFLILAAAAAALGACAKSPDAIAPVSMGNAYAGVSCQAASAELTAARANLTALESAQRGAAAGDAIGVFLIGVPTSSLMGGNKEGQIATEKGRVIALETRLRSC